MGGKRTFGIALEADEPAGPVILINVVAIDPELVRIVEKSE